MSKAKDLKPLALADTLRDLALLRTSDLNLATLVPAAPTDATQTSEEDQAVQESLQSSHEFVQVARAAIKVNDQGEADTQGQRIEAVRESLSNVKEGLSDA